MSADLKSRRLLHQLRTRLEKKLQEPRNTPDDVYTIYPPIVPNRRELGMAPLIRTNRQPSVKRESSISNFGEQPRTPTEVIAATPLLSPPPIEAPEVTQENIMLKLQLSHYKAFVTRIEEDFHERIRSEELARLKAERALEKFTSSDETTFTTTVTEHVVLNQPRKPLTFIHPFFFADQLRNRLPIQPEYSWQQS